MNKTRRIRSREKYNRDFLNHLQDRELQYVYALIDRATRTIGYFGVTNDPMGRRWQHQQDLWYKRGRPSKWRDRFNAKPEMVLLVVCSNRHFAEVVESTLIGRYGSGDQMIINDYKYWNPEQKKFRHVQDDMPFLECRVDGGFFTDCAKLKYEPVV